MAATIPEQHCNAKDLDQEQRKSIALNSLKKQDSIRTHSITYLKIENQNHQMALEK